MEQTIKQIIDRLSSTGLTVEEVLNPDWNNYSINFRYKGNRYSIVHNRKDDFCLICYNGKFICEWPEHRERKMFTLSEISSIDLEMFLNYVYDNFTNLYP